MRKSETTTGTDNKTKAHLPLAVLPVILAMCLGLWAGLTVRDFEYIQAENGFFDLRGVDFASMNIYLKEPVEYIADALLTPEEFAARENDAVIGYTDSVACLTSRIRLLLPDDGWYTFDRNSIDYSERLYVSGEWLLDVGTPGENRETSTPDTARITFTARPVDGVIEIIQQSSNFVHRDGGDHADWTIGDSSLLSQARKADFIASLILGCYLALFVLHALFYFLMRGYRANLYFALFCLVWFLRTGVTGTKIFSQLLPWLDWYAKFRIEYIAVPVSAALAVAILAVLFPDVLHKWFLRAVYVVSAVFGLMFLFMNTVFMSYAILVCEVIYAAAILYIIVLFLVKLRKVSLEQGIMLGGTAVFFYATLRDFLYHNSIYIPPSADTRGLTQIAMLVFTFFEAVAVFIATMKETERLRASEQNLAAENLALGRMNHLKTELMETISHEARTPLAVLASYSGLVAMELRAKGVDAQTAADLDTIAFEAKRVAGLIDGMKRLTLISGETTKRVSLDMGEVIRQTAGLYRHILERENVELTTHIPDNLPPVFGSPEELTQVLLNVLQNAKNYTINGSVTITAINGGNNLLIENGELRIENENNSQFITVSVTDTGAGIAPKLLPHVFKKGVHGTGGGSGIGLAICEEVIKSHGGSIGIESAENKGTTITFTLPVYREDDSYGE